LNEGSELSDLDDEEITVIERNGDNTSHFNQPCNNTDNVSSRASTQK
jgi:hypothetical protein